LTDNGSSPPKCSVLIVEDDRATREAMTLILVRLGYCICAVASIAEGVEKLDGQACAVLDLNLPDGLGTHILKRIRDERRPIRVAVVSGTTDTKLFAEALQFGAELVLRKPLDVGALVAWLDKGE